MLLVLHSLIRGVLIQSCSAGAKIFTNYVFFHQQFSGVMQKIENHCAILTLLVYVDYYQNNQFYIVKIEFLKFCFIGTMIFGTLAWTIKLYMTKYIIGKNFSSGGATLYKNPSDQTVLYLNSVPINRCKNILVRTFEIVCNSNMYIHRWKISF